jgi:hypothetical protein
MFEKYANVSVIYANVNKLYKHNIYKINNMSSTNTVYYCRDCNYNFKRKQNYEKHLETAKHKIVMSTKKKDLRVCPGCSKYFSHRSSLSRHKTICGNIKTDDIVDILQKENEELRKKIEKLEKTNHITNNNTNIENQNNIININCFGNENMDYITDKVVLHCISKVYGSIPLLIEKIHFDPEHPENHNIKIPNKKLPHANVMTEKRSWELVKLDDAIGTMIDNGYNLLDETFQEKGHILPNHQQKHFKNFQAKYEDGDKNTIKDIKERVELLVLNKTR